MSLLLIMLASLKIGFAQETVQDILDLHLRPTIAQHEAVFGPIGNKSVREVMGPLNIPSGSFGYEHLHEDILREMPHVIAAFERAFPGATFYGLGRDVEMVSDILDSYYRSLGQKDRVKRLGASGTSFPSSHDFEKNKDLIYGFLKSNGLDLNRIESEFPYVVFDISSWRQMSQLRQIGRAVYEVWSASGRSPRELYEHFNLIALGYSFPKSVFQAGFDFDAFRAEQKERAKSSGVEQPVFIPSMNFTYRTAWHGLFQTFTRHGDAVISNPGPVWELGSRVQILWDQYEIRKVTASQEFHERVKKAAKDFGYEFPLERTRRLNFVGGRGLRSSLVSLAETKSVPVAENRSAVIQLVEVAKKEKTKEGVLKMIEDATMMRMRESLSHQEYAAFLASTLGHLHFNVWPDFYEKKEFLGWWRELVVNNTFALQKNFSKSDFKECSQDQEARKGILLIKTLTGQTSWVDRVGKAAKSAVRMNDRPQNCNGTLGTN